MPNWCSNHLTIIGPKAELYGFKEKAESDESDLTFANFVPSNNHTDDWGTKWEAQYPHVEDIVPIEESGKSRLGYQFDTAWGPPGRWLEKVAKQYPTLRFELVYGENGMNFYGKGIFENGECLCEEDIDPVEYLSRYDGTFNEERGRLETGDLEELKQQFLDGTIQEDLCFPQHTEQFFINRLERKDLPLFINCEWMNDDSAKLIEKRLKEE